VKWERINPHFWRRECLRYTIDVVSVPGSATGQRFTAWRIASAASDPPHNLGCRDSFRDAAALAAADIRKLSNKAAQAA